MRICIIGAGASGLMCAYILSSHNMDITIFEKNNKIGKKLLLTGNGKCNYTNLDFSLNNFYTDNKLFLQKLFEEIDNIKLIEILKEIGIEPFYNGDYVYPRSLDAKSLIYAFKDYLEYKKVKIVLNKEIKTLKEVEDYDYVIFATGGSSYKNTGSTGFAYEIAPLIGHNITKTKPALVPLIPYIDDNLFSFLKGQRVKSKVSLYINNKFIEEDIGEVQFNDDNISGIVILSLSSLISNNNNKNDSFLLLNFIYEKEYNDIINILHKRRENIKYKLKRDFLSGFCNEKLALYITSKVFSNKDLLKETNTISDKQIEDITKLLTNFKIKIKDVSTFDKAQTTKGGIKLDEISDSFQSLKNNKYYFIGETVDVDAKCGGYNLSFAMISGYKAAMSIIKNEI
ncbi:MAG: aminoacetone oxidase family FAD-binding enzyme [Eubacteriales bacterium]|nr:aminoacetone oxidase family FAD-binding enzyme [Eubacteriales bacterium]